MDHPGALRHPADGEAVAGDRCRLGHGVGRHDRLGRRGAALGRHRLDGRPEPGEELVEGEPHADDAGREHQDLFGLQIQQPRRLGAGGEGVELAALARRRVRHARVDHDRLRLGLPDVVAVHGQAGGLDLVAAEHRRAHCRRGRAEDGEILRRGSDTGVDSGGDEAARRGDAHARVLSAVAVGAGYIRPFRTRALLVIQVPRAGEGRPCRGSRARGSRSGRPDRLRPCRGCRSRR